MRINDLPEGEQVVTTVARSKIKPPDKPKPTPVWVYVLIVYFVAFLLWALKDDSYGGHPPEPYPYPPAKPYSDPYSPCPIPKTPECPW